MLNKILRFVKPSRPTETLADLLKNSSQREEFLGVAKLTPPSTEQILQDINHVLAYSQTQDYRVWAQEAWSKALIHLDKLLDPQASQETISFHRGALSASLDLLRMSHIARLSEGQMKKRAEAKPQPTNTIRR